MHCMAQIVNIFSLHARTLHADNVQTTQIGVVADSTAVGNEIMGECSHTANKRMMTNARELMNSGTATKNGMMADFHMPADHHVVGECDVIADIAVVSDMCISKKLTIVANACISATAVRTAMHGDTFADKTVCANDKLGRTAFMLSILWIATENGMRINLCASTKRYRLSDDNMAHQFRAITDDGARLNMAKWTDRYASSQLHTLLDESCRVDKSFLH